ncbi:MAG: hypothetical protein IPM39_23460 [Chloroflexi bacterium]|nr:hypothetical protein [Chloroflexota bacterium]
MILQNRDGLFELITTNVNGSKVFLVSVEEVEQSFSRLLDVPLVGYRRTGKVGFVNCDQVDVELRMVFGPIEFFEIEQQEQEDD